MTRLQSSALDYAIACLARGQRPASLEQLREYVDGDAYSRAVQDVQSAELVRMGDARYEPSVALDVSRRIVRAWLALYLRRVRREAAFDRWLASEHDDPAQRRRWRWASTGRPLWLDAPTHDPLVSPWQRHGLPRRPRESA